MDEGNKDGFHSLRWSSYISDVASNPILFILNDVLIQAGIYKLGSVNTYLELSGCLVPKTVLPMGL